MRFLQILDINLSILLWFVAFFVNFGHENVFFALVRGIFVERTVCCVFFAMERSIDGDCCEEGGGTESMDGTRYFFEPAREKLHQEPRKEGKIFRTRRRWSRSDWRAPRWSSATAGLRRHTQAPKT